MHEKIQLESHPNSNLIEINPNGLYTRSDLAALLSPCGVNVDHFIARIRPRKVFKRLWTGEDLLAALRAAHPLADRLDAPQLPAPANGGNRSQRYKAHAALGRPGGKLDAYMESLKGGR